MLYFLVILVALAWCWPLIADLCLLAIARSAYDESERTKR